MLNCRNLYYINIIITIAKIIITININISILSNFLDYSFEDMYKLYRICCETI